MPHAAAFDSAKFASIMKEEIQHIATQRYGSNSAQSVGKGFAFWCIKSISPSLSEPDVELARSICESAGSGDENIDGAWKDEDTLFLMQSKYSEPKLSNEEGDDFHATSFPADVAEQLEQGFDRIFRYASGESRSGAPDRKLLQITGLYDEAKKNHLRINLIAAISGGPRKGLIEKIAQLNSKFEQDRNHYPKHVVYLYDLEKLNQTVSDNRATPPGVVYLQVEKDFKLENPDNTTYAFACTVDASELARVRHECGYNIYHSNFRFLLTRGGVARPKIEKTLDDPGERLNFWRYNNGITIACETVTKTPGNNLEIKGLQVVNGLQTIEALYENRDRKDRISDVKVLVRIIPTTVSATSDPFEARQLEERIAEYSNSQTPIRPRDLRSNDAVQIEIERILSEVYGFKYVRKVGETPGLRGRPSRQRVDNEEAAQAALSFWHGLSHEAKHKRRLIFEKASSAVPGFYDMIFNDKTSAQYILLPYLLYDDEYKFMKDIKDKITKGTYRSLDMLGLSVVGDAFKSGWGIGPNASDSQKTRAILRSAVDFLKRDSGQTKKLWRLVFKALGSIAERRRRVQARKDDVEAEDIPMLNVVARIHYDKDLKSELKRRPEIQEIRRIVKSLQT